MNKVVDIRVMRRNDWEKVAQIYQQGIESGNATFEQNIPTYNEWDKNHIQPCRLVAEMDEVVGWGALSKVSNRCVYKGVAEISVYVSNQHLGQKIGTKILKRLIEESEEEGIWTLQAGIFPENKTSLQLHKNLGFREVGYRERIGKMNGKWRNTILLERRSQKIE